MSGFGEWLYVAYGGRKCLVARVRACRPVRRVWLACVGVVWVCWVRCVCVCLVSDVWLCIGMGFTIHRREVLQRISGGEHPGPSRGAGEYVSS